MEVLHAIIDSGIKYRFNIQARYEVGFDDEMLELLKKAGFFELDMGTSLLMMHLLKLITKEYKKRD